jgi:lipid-binding SYLF domain-containing protein
MLLLLVLSSMAGCGIVPQRGDTLSAGELAAANAALEQFAADERLTPFFAEAEVIAVYPAGIRAGLGIGGGLGQGVVFQDGRPIGRTGMYQLSIGANVGGQVYRQILFFKSEAAFGRLMSDVMEFAGQANLAVAMAGGAATPSFNSEVALFTQLRSGLLVEGSVGAHSYTFRRLPAGPARQPSDEDANNETGQ